MMHRHMKETVPTGGPSYHLDQHFSGILRAPSFTKIVDADAFHAFSYLEPQKEAQTIYRRHSDFGRFESGISLRQKDHGWNMVRIHVSKEKAVVTGQGSSSCQMAHQYHSTCLGHTVVVRRSAQPMMSASSVMVCRLSIILSYATRRPILRILRSRLRSPERYMAGLQLVSGPSRL